MATIKATVIKKPRKVRNCGNCGATMKGEQVRLYGSFETDPPFTLYVCRECASHDPSPKVKKALA